LEGNLVQRSISEGEREGGL